MAKSLKNRKLPDTKWDSGVVTKNWRLILADLRKASDYSKWFRESLKKKA